jgi:hypothetical protein
MLKYAQAVKEVAVRCNVGSANPAVSHSASWPAVVQPGHALRAAEVQVEEVRHVG